MRRIIYVESLNQKFKPTDFAKVLNHGVYLNYTILFVHTVSRS